MKFFSRATSFWCCVTTLLLAVVAASPVANGQDTADSTFTIAVIPDTQNYLDYQHQRAAGFPFDAGELFLEQMRYVAARLQHNDGDIAFVTSVGDVWQSRVDARTAPGETPDRSRDFGLMPKVTGIEVPLAQRGFGLIAGKVPFSVVPGNHDYDWSWKDGVPVRVGGLVNFNAVFGEQSPYFKGKSWYAGAHEGGGDSAQIFTAGGRRFLHLGLQYDPSDASLAWARSMIERYPGLPTIVTTHKYLETDGSRPADDMAPGTGAAAQYNSPELVWQKLVREHDQIFLVLSGHFNAQAFRVDENRAGHKVWQIMSDYQNRHQTAKEKGLDADASLPVGALGVGDGWLRLMTFDLTASVPTIRVRTYSTHYKAFSSDLPQYVSWYKAQEKPRLSDADYLASDDFTIQLTDFRARFESGTGPRFAVSFPASAHPQPVTGRLFLMVSRTNEPEVRLQSHWFNSPQIAAIDVDQLKPGATAVIDATVPGTPLKSLAQLPAGDYYVQAVMNVYTRFERADGHVVWAHMDQGEGQQFNKSPGNLYSKVARLRIGPAGHQSVSLSLSEIMPPIVDPPDTEWIKRIKFKSERLSKFWGRPMYLGAVVLLPRDYASNPGEHYPVIYHLAEHSSKTSPFMFATEPSAENEEQRRQRLSAGYETGHEFYESWKSDGFPRMIAVSFQHPTPFADMSGLVNSVNNGPYGDALMQELLPYIEKTFRIIREPRTRILFGQASAGRDALSLQLRHPDFFGGAWILHPWAFDHRRYFALNLYDNDNAFEVKPGDIPAWARNPSSWIPVERYLTRLGDGTPIATFRQLSQHDLVMARKAGGEFGIDDAMMSPIGADGYPRPLWDRVTGRIDREVARYWAQNYDLAAYAQRNWAAIGPHLDEKIHMFVGDTDHFWRNEGVRRFEDFLKATRKPRVSADFAYGPGKGHWQPSTNAHLIGVIADHISASAPRERAGRSYALPQAIFLQ